jgi:hypothetical protein
MNREKLEFIEYCKKYADGLGLKGKIFETVDESKLYYHSLTYCPRTKFILNKKIANSLEELQRLERSLSPQYEIFYKKIVAYGGPQVPVTKRLLESSFPKITSAILHEKWHRSVREYYSGKNLMIDEACAEVVSWHHTQKILTDYFGLDSKEMEAFMDKFSRLKNDIKIINSLVPQLYDVYHSNMSLKEKEKIRKNLVEEKNKDMRYWKLIPNNAQILEFYIYTALYPLCEDVYLRNRGSIKILKKSLKWSKMLGLKAGIRYLLKNSAFNNIDVIDVFSDRRIKIKSSKIKWLFSVLTSDYA